MQSKYNFPRGHVSGEEPYDINLPIRVQGTLGHFTTSYMDAYLLQGPFRGDVLSKQDAEAWNSLEDLYKSGKARLIDVSNFDVAHPQVTIIPHLAQIRTFSATGWDDRIGGVRAHCLENGISFETFSILTANRAALVRFEPLAQGREVRPWPNSCSDLLSRVKW